MSGNYHQLSRYLLLNCADISIFISKLFCDFAGAILLIFQQIIPHYQSFVQYSQDSEEEEKLNYHPELSFIDRFNLKRVYIQ